MNHVPVPETSGVYVASWTPDTLERLYGPVGGSYDSIEGWSLDRLLYIAVDELIEAHLTLSIARWPQVDTLGRVRFPRRDGRWRIGAETPVLALYLHQHRMPRELADRELRIGDAFAAARREDANLDALDEQAADPAAWMSPPVVDISAEARDLAKIAFYSAVAPPLRPEESRRDAAIVALAETRTRGQDVV